ncbi:MAG: MaoC family dehydratase, partial [Vulcanimicrobiaceae bacterium]
MTHRTGDGPLATVGERFDQSVTFTRDSIVAFATAVADFNPMHHDEVYAAGTRFGGLIASGTQTMSIFAAMVPTHFARAGSAKIGGVGLEFSFRLLEAVRV